MIFDELIDIKFDMRAVFKPLFFLFCAWHERTTQVGDKQRAREKLNFSTPKYEFFTHVFNFTLAG